MQAGEAAKCLQKHLFLCTDTLKQQKAAAGRLSAPSCSLQFLIIFVRSIPRCDIPARRRRHR